MFRIFHDARHIFIIIFRAKIGRRKARLYDDVHRLDIVVKHVPEKSLSFIIFLLKGVVRDNAVVKMCTPAII